MHFPFILFLYLSSLGVTAPAVSVSPSQSRCNYSALIDDKQGKLNTDLLQDRWGPITLDPVPQKGEKRKVYFRDQQKQARGYAETNHLYTSTTLPKELTLAQHLIDQGYSIGETFRSLGFQIRKDPIEEVGERSMRSDLRKELGTLPAQVRRYQFVVIGREEQEYPYAIIEEWTPLVP